MQPRQRRVHVVVDLRALGGIGGRHLRLPEHAAVDIGHDEERRADDGFVGAVEHRLGDREALRVQRADDAVLAVDRVRGRQQLAGRLSPQHIAAQRRFQHVGRIRLAALELAHQQRPGKARHMLAQIGFEPPDVEPQRLGHVLGAGKGALAVDELMMRNLNAEVYRAAKKSSNAFAVASGFSSGR